LARASVVLADGAERTADVSDVRVVEGGMTWWCVNAGCHLGHVDLLFFLDRCRKRITSTCATGGRPPLRSCGTAAGAWMKGEVNGSTIDEKRRAGIVNLRM
jgi:hypothetical protein